MDAWIKLCARVERMSLDNNEFCIRVRRELLNGQLLFFTRNIDKLYMRLQERFNAGKGTAGMHMTIQEMTSELKQLQAEEPIEFNKM